MKEFITKIYHKPTQGEVAFSAPSNIALVKYWGKKEHQIPANPSLSFTLKHAQTKTKIHYEALEKQEQVRFKFIFEGEEKPSFHPKLQTFFERIVAYCPYLLEMQLTIESENTFPHSSGIASSASAMAALSSCIIEIEKQLATEPKSQEYYWNKTSFLARLGSGSACRSVQGEVVVWGANETFVQASDAYGISFPKSLHPIFKNYQDTILLVDKGEKSVSSTLGHQLMNNHPFASQRFVQAHQNLSSLSQALESGDIERFIEIVESEALTLHAMMQTSIPYFILMKPNTLEIIQKIWSYRAETKVPVCFTLDAGANVHVLFPEKYKEQVSKFIKEELAIYCQNQHYIEDEMGTGALMC